MEETMQDGSEYPRIVVDESNVSKRALDMVRVKFNPSGSTTVDEVKLLTARLITIMDENPTLDVRLRSIAIHDYEGAAMWAVKALTSEPKVPQL
jgi:hypothetical protein